MYIDKKILYIFSAISSRMCINKNNLYKFFNIINESSVDFYDTKEEKYKYIIKDFLKSIDAKTNFENILSVLQDKQTMNEIDYNCEKSVEFCNVNNVDVLSILDENYPKKLKNIERPPYLIFVKGNFDRKKLRDSFAIVGTRKPSESGIEFCENISKYVASKKYLNISGLARGCDTIGHRICIKNTAAILGYGLAQNVYPKENEILFEEIVSNNGFIVSENLPYDTINIRNLIDRNRIITALSDNLIIAETSLKGGSAHTFKFAKKQNKNIFINKSCEDFIEKHKKHLIIIDNDKDLENKLNLLKMKKMKQKNMFQ